MKKLVMIVLSVLLVCTLGYFVLGGSKTVGKNVKEDSFKEFYYTYSSTVNPPEYQRYRIYTDGGKKMFYHEKREGNNTFLTEEDITVAGDIELTPEEWNTFWNLVSGGKVKNRKENVLAGGAGPWLYLYWNGDRDKCQEFTFENYEKETAFEKYCVEIKEKAIKAN